MANMNPEPFGPGEASRLSLHDLHCRWECFLGVNDGLTNPQSVVRAAARDRNQTLIRMAVTGFDTRLSQGLPPLCEKNRRFRRCHKDQFNRQGTGMQ